MAIAADRIAVSTWSLHRTLGVTHPHDLTTDAVGGSRRTYGPGQETLLSLPSALAREGYRRLEIVSFHMPSRDPAYLRDLRAELKSQGIVLQTLLIDDGDISHPDLGERDRRWIAGWIEVANELGAENARIIAGKQKPSREALDRSAAALLALADGNKGSSVRLVTENWLALLPGPDQVHDLLDRVDGKIGLLADFGNWHGPTKYADLQSIFGRAELCHAKANFVDAKLDEDDYRKCATAAEAAGYTGPYTLIFASDEPDEWTGLAAERAFLTGQGH